MLVRGERYPALVIVRLFIHYFIPAHSTARDTLSAMSTRRCRSKNLSEQSTACKPFSELSAMWAAADHFFQIVISPVTLSFISRESELKCCEAVTPSTYLDERYHRWAHVVALIIETPSLKCR
ncbi:jg18900 [Pararge aegeria aegeria]|uniref:Jg18900 protein n=1 Tax=Pararge aegeria aegeria TaxID=348720 RepID=A0A8S4QTY0_9NEOP|nr:jg18900 [Pararge aegeria aegeria]